MPTDPIVLVVETEQREAHSLASQLRDPRWRIVSAVDAPSAIRAARDLMPGAVVISGRVLGGGGVVALRHLRRSVHTGSIPVVGVCGTGLQGTMLAAGAQQCLAERTTPDELRTAVAQHLGHPPDVREAPAEILLDPARLTALEKTGLLDSAPEETFDRLTRLAARLLTAPTTLVSLVTKDRQFFKSQYGLGDPWASRREIPLSHSFCQWVVSSGEDLSVSDARRNEILRKNPAVDELSVRAYAGALVSAPDGQPIGTLCALDADPRAWNDEELATLMDLRDIVQGHIALRMVPAVETARKAITAASRNLTRAHWRFTEDDRSDLVAVIDDLSRRLTAETSSSAGA
jgi:GAF domain-containing protein